MPSHGGGIISIFFLLGKLSRILVVIHPVRLHPLPELCTGADEKSGDNLKWTTVPLCGHCWAVSSPSSQWICFYFRSLQVSASATVPTGFGLFSLQMISFGNISFICTFTYLSGPTKCFHTILRQRNTQQLQLDVSSHSVPSEEPPHKYCKTQNILILQICSISVQYSDCWQCEKSYPWDTHAS